MAAIKPKENIRFPQKTTLHNTFKKKTKKNTFLTRSTEIPRSPYYEAADTCVVGKQGKERETVWGSIGLISQDFR